MKAEPTPTAPDALAKIHPLSAFPGVLDEARTRGKVVHCHGVFDLLHVGHIRHLRAAKAMGATLVVTITADSFVNKGPGRPVFSEQLRAETLASLDCVDHVAVNHAPLAVPAIQAIRPDLYAKGPDYSEADQDITGGIVQERLAVEAHGGQLVTTDDITFSSSRLINQFMPVLPEDASTFLERFRQSYSIDDVLGYIDQARDLRVLVVGETILDEYQYCESIGKASKDPVLVARMMETETYGGGALAIANHLSELCDHVGLFSYVGADDGGQQAVDDLLQENVHQHLVQTSEAPTIIKRRFVEKYLLQKLFETYVMDEEALRDDERAEITDKLGGLMDDHDLVIVADYGHGLLDGKAVGVLSGQANYLAVNTQSNAGNRGFNTISKYPRADYVSLAEHEFSLETRTRRGDPRKQLQGVVERLACARGVMTRGRFPTLCYAPGDGFVEVPSVAHRVVDRVGAGDAVLALSSLLAQQGAPMEVQAFVGNVAGAEAVQVMGNKDHIQRLPLFKHIETLMK